MERINIAELLKDCPKGMELDCTMYDNVFFDQVIENVDYPIRIKIGKTDVINLTKEGHWNKFSNAKCVIFPKGKTTWEGFHRPFKDGDILTNYDTIFIYNGTETDLGYGTRVIIDTIGAFAVNLPTKKYGSRFATEEEKQKLFDAIKANGYRWNVETKILEKLPKFKVGNRVKNNANHYEYTITDIKENYYIMKYSSNNSYHVPFCIEDNFELIPDKFDITNFKLFDQVLARDTDNCVWRIDFYSNYENERRYPYGCIGNDYYQCIPYNDETAHLANTTNPCPDKYKTWKDE